MPESIDPRSHTIADDRRADLLRLFPEAAGEGGTVDVEKLRLAIGDKVAVGKERYGLNWPGKADCFATIQAPSLATLRPAPKESVDWDSTENLIIEGDNLEVLKLLQKAYLGKVKMIYIDPPYNTGNDFIYPDNYSESLDTYLQYTGQVDDEGKKFSTNLDTDGRFHSKWLNMMYPRLYLARNLLTSDGLLLVSIDDHELRNLRCISDEIFGEENFCGMFVWEKKKKPSFLHSSMGITTEYILAYARDRSMAAPFVGGKVEQGKMYPFNNAGNPLATLTFPPGSVKFWTGRGEVEPQDMSEGNIVTELLDRVEIRNGVNAQAFRLKGEWRYSQAKVDELIRDGEEIVIRRLPFRPNLVSKSDRDKKMANLLSVKGTATPTYEDATEEVRVLLGSDVVDYPKPVGLIQTLVAATTANDDIVLDFFAGSGTTGHAVMAQNAEDGAKRRVILVQLPEPTGRDDYPNIASITRERMRRAIRAISQEKQRKLSGEGTGHSGGFRAYSLTPSCILPWNATPTKEEGVLQARLSSHVRNVASSMATADLLCEILLRSGFALTTPVEEKRVDQSIVHSVAGGAMLVCLERELTLSAIRAMADIKPLRIVCLDSSFAGNDQLKANAVQTFKNRGITFKTI